jgi:hypothetical protein
MSEQTTDHDEKKDIMRIVTIFWPEDLDRGMEAYGPFDSIEAQSKFVDDCQEAQVRGWGLLDGATYLIHRVAKPFDPTQFAVRGVESGIPAVDLQHDHRRKAQP